MMPLKRPICFIRLATTGLSERQDRIIYISIFKIHPGGSEEYRERYINPDPIKISEGSYKVHGIEQSVVDKARTFSTYAKSLYDKLSGCDLVGYGLHRFIIPFLVREFERCGMAWPPEDVHFMDAGGLFINMEPRDMASAHRFYGLGRLVVDPISPNSVMPVVNIFKAQIEEYPQFEGDLSKLEKASYMESQGDFSGLIKKKDGVYVYNTSRLKGVEIADDPTYAIQMLHMNFPQDTKLMLHRILKELNIPIEENNPQP